MSLNKSIESGREHRKPYRKSKAIDSSCRNHGSCPYCKGNRLHNRNKTDMDAKMRIQEVWEKV